MSASESGLLWLAGDMLRNVRGHHLAVFDFKCAFDESGTHAGSPIICVAGYIMEISQAAELDREWNAVLNWGHLEHSLPYFHMADCAPDPGNGVFSGISKAHRIQVVSQLIGVIKRRTVQGLAATVSTKDFSEILAGHPFYPDPYVLISHLVLTGITRWIATNDQSVNRVAYFFESGHNHRTDANEIMCRLFRNPMFGTDFRSAGHAFVPKIGNPAVQAADLLAWQWLKDRKNAAEGRPRRKDLKSLLEHHHTIVHMGPETLQRIAETREPLIRHMLNVLEDVRPQQPF